MLCIRDEQTVFPDAKVLIGACILQREGKKSDVTKFKGHVSNFQDIVFGRKDCSSVF